MQDFVHSTSFPSACFQLPILKREREGVQPNAEMVVQDSVHPPSHGELFACHPHETVKTKCLRLLITHMLLQMIEERLKHNTSESPTFTRLPLVCVCVRMSGLVKFLCRTRARRTHREHTHTYMRARSHWKTEEVQHAAHISASVSLQDLVLFLTAVWLV